MDKTLEELRWCAVLEMDESRTVESRLVDRALDNVTQTLPEVVDDAAVKNKQLTDQLALLQQQLRDNQVLSAT